MVDKDGVVGINIRIISELNFRMNLYNWPCNAEILDKAAFRMLCKWDLQIIYFSFSVMGLNLLCQAITG